MKAPRPGIMRRRRDWGWPVAITLALWLLIFLAIY